MPMREKQFSGEFREGMPFLGGSLWIDFINTTPVIKGTAIDLIGDAAALASWAEQANIDTEKASQTDDPAALHLLREQLADAFDRLAVEEPLPPELIVTVNRLIERTAIRRTVVRAGTTAVLEEHVEHAGPPVAGAVAWDFAQFLSYFEPQRLRACGNPACTMKFYDVGKNNRRRWCTMSLCGNREKVGQYRSRKTARSAD